jgi:Sigma-70 region 2
MSQFSDGRRLTSVRTGDGSLSENVLEGFAAQKHPAREPQSGALTPCVPKVITRRVGEPGGMSEGSGVGEFETLFVKHYARIVGILRRIVGDHGRAEELASEVFLKLYLRPLAPDSGTVLAEIKPVQAQLLLLRASGDSYKELSAALEIEPGSVGTLLVRAEAAFEQRYLELFGAEEDV